MDVVQIERETRKQQDKMRPIQEGQQQQNPIGQIQHAQAQQQIRIPTAYDIFFKGLQPLPPLPVAAAPAPQEAVAKTKAQRRREKQLRKIIAKENESEYARANKQMAENPHLIDESMVQGMYVFRQKSTREKWSKEKLPHSTLTREETLKAIIEEGDYSNFENLDVLMRNVMASRELKKFVAEYAVNEQSNPQQIIQQMKQHAGPDGGVTPFVNPALRLALSLAQKTNGIPDGLKQVYRALDEAMTTEVMVATLTHQPQEQKVIAYFEGRGVDNPQHKAEQAITENKAQQIQIAKRLLLMQLSDFRKLTTVNGVTDASPWDHSMAVALSHCSRVALTFPKTDATTSNKQEQRAMWRSIFTINGENTAQDNSRTSSTHTISRRSVADGGIVQSVEDKVPFNLIGQRGMNCAIGGLGNAGVSGKTLSNDGSCGHFYSMHKEANEKNYGAMLMGLESDEAGVTNQMGHTHDWHATPEKASSLGGQRTDEIGDKYSGRQCDLTGMSARDIRAWMQALEQKMLEWQSVNGGVNGEDATALLRRLAGAKLDANGWAQLRQTLNVGANVADGFHG